IAVLDLLVQSTSNIVTALLFGTTYGLGDPMRMYLVHHLTNVMALTSASSLANFLPDWLSRLFSVLPIWRIGVIRRSRQKLLDFVRDRIDEHKRTLQEKISRDFIDGYLHKIYDHQHDPNSHFQERHLESTAVDFYIGGTYTTASFVHWLLLVCAQKTDTVQSRIQREIDEIVGPERQPTWEDRNRMHFTMASVWEILRWKTVSAVKMPRGPRKDTLVNGYVISEDTMVMSNVLAVHRDPTLWERPDDFDPTRFLASDDSGLVKKPEHLIAFSLGKRMCPAEKLATVEIFLFVASLLQKFTVFPEEGVRLPRLGSLAVTKAHPAVKNLRFLAR
ncbi:unnamed protein product, partial [Ixodes hexagonus]